MVTGSKVDVIGSLDGKSLKNVAFSDGLAFILGALAMKSIPVVVRSGRFCSDPEPLLLH